MIVMGFERRTGGAVVRPAGAGRMLMAGASAAALLYGVPAWAQDAAPAAAAAQQSTGTAAPSGDQGQPNGTATDQVAANAAATDDVVVTGVRASLLSAQARKRNADQIVDSIVAEDIGKLPDRNIAEALQRISGVQIAREYGEGSSVAIRGLTQVRTELNGRDIFTASNAGNTLSLEDVPSELLAGIDVYKNPSADLIEDQLSGTINFRTRKPFDFDGFKISGSVTNTYYDLVKQSQPAASLLVSDRWNTGIGEIGVLASVSYQRTDFRQDTISTQPVRTLDGSLNADGSPVSLADYTGLQRLGRLGQVTSTPTGAGIGEVYGDRRRLGVDVSVQWRPTSTLEFTGEVFRNDYKFRFDDFSYFAYSNSTSLDPLYGSTFTFAPNGDFQSGAFANVPIGANTSLDTRHSVTTDYSLNGKWRPTERLTISGDLQYVDAKTNFLRSIVGLTGVATTLTQDITGKLPSFQITSAAGLTDPSTYSSGYYLDDFNNSKATDKAGRLDAEYKFDNSLLRSIKLGVRFADRRNRFSDTGYRYSGLTGTPTDLEYVDLGDFFRGDADLFGNALFFSRATTLDYDKTRAELGITTTPTYNPSGTNSERRKTYAGYAAAFFKSDNDVLPIDGNIGVRVIRTSEDVSGYYQQTNLITNANGSQSTGTTDSNLITFSRSYTSVLPSLNLRAHLSDKLQVRFAASKNIARPDFDQVNPALTISEPATTDINNQHVTTGGNPYLKQMRSDNLDASVEWYFTHTGSLTGALFYKHIDDYIQTAISTRAVTFASGVTANYDVTSYNNVGNAKLKGAEVAYQQFFDFLPGVLKGLGAQANFTYVDANAPGPAIDGPAQQVPLEGLSKYNYNLIGIYELGKLSARVAYNWRSRFLVTTQGNGSGNLPIFERAFGQMDASVTFNVTPHFSLTLNGVNLTNTTTTTYYGLDTRPRDAIMTDRRISGIARITF